VSGRASLEIVLNVRRAVVAALRIVRF
jgi:hypothetical protein